jgi:hypothetical protein
VKFKLPNAPSGARPGEAPSGLSKGEKRRFVFLIGGFVVVASILVTTLAKARAPLTSSARQPIVDESLPSAPLLAVPELDRARLETLVADRAPADRVVLESEAADLVLAAARRYTARHYAELKAPELDAARIASLLADPTSARGQPFVARGRIVELGPRVGAVHEDQFQGRLELEDGATVHFLVLGVPAHAAEVGGFVRVDGLFLKLFASEDELQAGTWHAGPLLVGASAERSFPGFGRVTELDASIFDDVEDADLGANPPRIVGETPAEPLWHLMAYARDVPEGAIDWAKAPTLDQRLLDQMLEHPAEFRAQPVIVPISRLQDGRVRLAGENPARMERTMQGWIGNNTWKNAIQFHSPVLRPELVITDLVQGRGFFLHDFSYESKERGLRVAPVFVLQTLERFVPAESPGLRQIPWFVAGLGAFLTALFVVLARRDKRQTADFEEARARRRRARAERTKGNLGPAAR